jgi:peptide/nickel transport system ATP-binding protein
VKQTILSVKDISKSFINRGSVKQQIPKVLNGVSLEIQEKEIIGIVGESGCGKTTLARIVAGLETPNDGDLVLRENQISFSEPRSKQERKEIQMIFQNTLASFNPRMTIGDSIAQPIIEHNILLSQNLLNQDINNIQKEINRLLDSVGLEIELANRFPHQVSGGQIQRAAIARAIACKPTVLIADEPTSALDVSIRLQILELFKKLRETQELTIIVITHDLPSLKYLADRIFVMYNGEIIESGETNLILSSPKQAYTKRLISAIPSLNPQDKTFEKFTEKCSVI